MPRISPQPLQHAPVARLLMPFGAGQVISAWPGRLDVELTVTCCEFPPSVPEVRAHLLGRAEAAAAALEAGGYEVRETVITLSRPPVRCTVRFEVSEPGA